MLSNTRCSLHHQLYSQRAKAKEKAESQKDEQAKGNLPQEPKEAERKTVEEAKGNLSQDDSPKYEPPRKTSKEQKDKPARKQQESMESKVKKNRKERKKTFHVR